MCSVLISRIYDVTLPLVPKRKKRKYERIMENIIEEEKYSRISCADAVDSSRAVKFFICFIDAVIAVLATAVTVAGAIAYFKFCY